MANLSTQLGYKAPAKKAASPYAMPQPGRGPTSGVTRALANVAPPAAPSYQNPYQDPMASLFPTNDFPTVQSQAPAGTPSTYAPQAPVAPAAPSGYSFNLETDPILQQMHALAAKQRSEADASALEQRKQLAIQYGDQGYGNSIDSATGQAAAQNPFSVTANLANQYQTGQQGLETNLNQHNLFYSGERIKELAQALQDYQHQQANAAGAFQTGLGNINQNRVAGLMGADQSEQGAYQDAYSRALQAALANPVLPAAPAAAPAAASPGAGMDNSTFSPNSQYGFLNPGTTQAPSQVDPGFNITPAGGPPSLSTLSYQPQSQQLPPPLLRQLMQVR
jgi:hypothetical protein